MKDLFILVADKNAEFALKGALSRPEALGIRPVDFEIRTHFGRDGGVRKNGPDILSLLRRQYSHGLLIFDFEGCGEENESGVALEIQLDAKLQNDWGNNAKTIVIEPELDVWVWGADNAIEEALDWPPGKKIRVWLREQGFTFEANEKPTRPKEALEAVLKIPNLPRSSALYQQIAKKISLQRCKDEAFLRLRRQMQVWFPK
jgi:hypothetical protein